jgi:ABC-type glycerol-3-phosphate transport system substrate-binding protein
MDHVSFNTVLSIWLSSDAAPDLHMWWGGARTQEIVDLGYCLDYSNEFENIKNHYSEGVQNGHMVYNGKAYAVPLAVFTYGLYYRTDVFNQYGIQPPQTWNQLVDACETIWSESNGDIYPFQVPSKFPWLPDLQFTSILSQSVSPEFFNGLITGTESWQDPQVLEAFQRYAELVPYMPSYHTELGEFEATQEIAEKRVTMEISGPWRSSMLKDAGLTPVVDFDWVPPPTIKSEFTKTMPTHSDVLVANVHTKYPEECRRFLEFVASTEGQQIFSSTSSTISANDDVETSGYDQVQLKFLNYMQGTTDSVVEVSLAVREEITTPWFDLLAEFLQNPNDYQDIARRIDEIQWAD